MDQFREIFIYKRYFLDFYDQSESDVQSKIEWTLNLIQYTQRVPIKYLRYLEGTFGLYEIRVELKSNIYRIFCFFDNDKLVILCNGFQKKSQKTPKREIERALRIKREYQNERQ